MALNDNPPQSDHADQRIDSPAFQHAQPVPEGDAAPQPAREDHSEKDRTDSASEAKVAFSESEQIRALEAELLGKEQLVETLTERLTEVAEELEKNQHHRHEASKVDSRRIKELEACLREEAELVETLKERLGEVAAELERCQNNPQQTVDPEGPRVEELEAELQEKTQLVTDLTQRLSEVEAELEQSRREYQEFSAAEKQRVQSLETELQEKDQLVVMLTERLEQVAEQLDRRHRTGADRGMTVSGGIPREVIEEQQKLTQDLHTFLEQMQGMETESSLARIEMQIAELKKMVEDGFVQGPAAPKPSSLVDYLSTPNVPATEEVLPETQLEPTETESAEPPPVTETTQPEADPSVSGWEAMKLKLLSGQGVDVSSDLQDKPAPAAPAPEPQPAPVEHNSALLSGSAGRTLASYKPPLPEAPAEINYDQASHEELTAAIRERDQYISLLIKRLREAETAVIPVNWEAINNAPEDLVKHLQTLQHDLEHNLGLAEVEISIERARLSRTELMLQNREEQIRKKEKQLGLNLERGEDEAVPEEKNLDDDQKKRWLGFLN
ncbi:Chromosome partition protein Smc [Gimesia panareensis]|uniref:Chromosome partition protein Smc n=1 Tax=Gimesia panareensis TaxID=2527978 RepID=A0A518FTS6_9PLAN|nr:hypothetical protein [Gimesia panareensis]QDV19739.1 Chromosome partition protein Smc [Gimesia panareensis]